MGSTDQKGLGYLPDLVYTENLLPLLSVNEILRLRRVCKPLKSICDNYLQTKCPSKTKVRLEDLEVKKFKYNDLLLDFLEFDSSSSIRIPSHSFHLLNGGSICVRQLSLNLSTRYGTQIKHLSLDNMVLPFVSNSLQFRFFQNLTNLSSLTLSNILVQNDANGTDWKIMPESLPTCFKNIRKFEVSKLWFHSESDASIFWGTLELSAGKLECFQFPRYVKGEDRETYQCQILNNCCKLIGDKSNIKCFDLRHWDYDAEHSGESLKLFSELSLRNKIQWKNVSALILAKPFYKTAWMPNADLIVSMWDFHSQNMEGLSFPNLVSLETSHMIKSLYLGLENGPIRDWSKIPQILSPSIYPALKILNVTTVNSEDNKYFSKAWQYLTNLEEVSFQLEGTSIRLSSEAFLGYVNETQEPPFLRLIKLKKLSFHIPYGQRKSCSINDAFHKAFRLMPLKEFNITSVIGIKRKIFTKDAILSLCSPGPFIENIEKFSFRNWSMEGVTDDEFQQLGRMFPNNQAL